MAGGVKNGGSIMSDVMHAFPLSAGFKRLQDTISIDQHKQYPMKHKGTWEGKKNSVKDLTQS